MKTVFLLIIVVYIFFASGISDAQNLKQNFETGKKAFYADDFDTANKLFSEMLNMESDSYEKCFYKGLIYFIYFDYEKSQKELTAALEYKKSPEAYFNRALTYEKQEKIQNAISDYTSAINENKRYTDAYFNRADLYQQLKDYSKAIKDYGKVIKINPKDDIAYYNRGLLYAETGKKSEAIEDFEEAIKIDKIWKVELSRKIKELKQ